VVTSNSKALIDDAEALLAAIRGSVLVHVHDGVQPAHLKVPLDSARLLNQCVTDIEDDDVRYGADALEAWLLMLAAETDPISHTRTRSLLDQISDLEVALIAYRAKVSSGPIDVAGFVDESFKMLRGSETAHAEVSSNGAIGSERFDLDSEVLEVFSEEADSLLENFRSNLGILSDHPTHRNALWELKKSAHTLKGAAGIVGLKKISKLAHVVEDLLVRLSEKNGVFNVEHVDLLLSAADCLKLLSDGENSSTIDHRVTSLHRRFGAALKSVAELQATPNNETGVAPASVGNASELRKVSSPGKVTAPIVRVSLDRVDDLVRNMRDLTASQAAFERRLDEFEEQLGETHNNTLRLQAASGKIESLRAQGGDLTRTRDHDLHQSAYELTETAKDATLIRSALDNVKTALEALYEDQCASIAEIQSRLVRLRNVEFGTDTNRLQRTVRVICEEEGKSAEVAIENGTLEVDTQVIDALVEPLLHLLKNAVVHGIELPETRRMLGKPEAGKITVRVSNKGANIVLSVTDDGRGIAFRPLLDKAVASNLISPIEAEQMTPDKIRELIFLPGLTTAQKLTLNAGRGVGMSIVRESVAARGGNISIETWPQKGTTFSIRIPRPFAEIDAVGDPVVQTDVETPAKRWMVLVVDDSPSVRLMTSRVIEKAGWNVETARDGLEALEKLHTMEPPSVILSDIEMPRMGGYEFVAALREDDALRNIPVIFVSSRTEDRQQAALAGVADYLTKPYDENKLVELIGMHAMATELVAA
jgi:chemosensory pili system protein ChpA (sensor histidine kinase/response regulator)